MARKRAQIAVFELVLFLLASGARAESGRIEINQAIALAGGVNGSTVADPPGFPVLITQPGSYVLTSDLSNPANDLHAIQIEAADASIDLGGFAITGGAGETGCSGFGLAIGIVGTRENATVRNGTIRKMRVAGIDLSGETARVEDVRVEDNCGAGVQVGSGALVARVTALRNGAAGIDCYAWCRLADASAWSNGASAGGLQVDLFSVVSESVAADNAATGLRGYEGEVVVHSIAARNQGDGILIFRTGNAIGNVVQRNTRYGISGSNAVGLGAFTSNFQGEYEGVAHACNAFTGGFVDCPSPPPAPAKP
ncbi:MAG: hypothetical protein DCC71_13305 [Proteobacteria bacterium]|nr:MAG: hypothetical protein DCC71_13305 [Pseudomonadota bacterium]